MTQKTYYRERDGHTYWWDAGSIWGAPTHVDGTFDPFMALPIDDFDRPLTKSEISEIVTALKG